MTEVAAGIHRIEAPLGDRYVCLYLLVGDDCALLVDTGIDSSAAELVRYADAIGFACSRIRYVLTSHADFDHSGGNGAVRELCPGVVFVCHELDRRLIEDVEALIDLRYGEFIADHGIDDGDAVRDFIREHSRHVPVDIGLSGGERLRLGSGWDVEVLHTPGHSRGHLSVWDPRSRSAVIADAVLWNSVPKVSGEPAFPPTYRHLDTYLASIQRLQGMPIETLLTSHYPAYHADDVAAFLGESRAFAERVETALRQELASAAEPPTLRELCRTLSPRLGSWGDSAWTSLAYPLLGHLERLESYGLAPTERRDGLLAWRWRGPRELA
jgi:glyoxylase-like metal-dependent hydrolase (beta-lactamase superfamily II)